MKKINEFLLKYYPLSLLFNIIGIICWWTLPEIHIFVKIIAILFIVLGSMNYVKKLAEDVKLIIKKIF